MGVWKLGYVHNKEVLAWNKEGPGFQDTLLFEVLIMVINMLRWYGERFVKLSSNIHVEGPWPQRRVSREVVIKKYTIQKKERKQTAKKQTQ